MKRIITSSILLLMLAFSVSAAAENQGGTQILGVQIFEGPPEIVHHGMMRSKNSPYSYFWGAGNKFLLGELVALRFDLLILRSIMGAWAELAQALGRMCRKLSKIQRINFAEPL